MLVEVETTEYEPCETGIVEVKDFIPGRASKKTRLVRRFFIGRSLLVTSHVLSSHMVSWSRAQTLIVHPKSPLRWPKYIILFIPITFIFQPKDKNFQLFSCFYEASMIDKKAGERPIQFEMSIGKEIMRSIHDFHFVSLRFRSAGSYSIKSGLVSCITKF